MVIINFKHLDIDNFRHFIVYEDGRVYNTKNDKEINGDFNRTGYCRVQLMSNGEKKRFFRHRLVAMLFIPNDDPVNKKFVNHKDGNKMNNHVSNLEWVSQSENEKHKFDVLNADRKYKRVKVIIDNNEEIIYPSREEAAKALNISLVCLYRYLKNGHGSSKQYSNYIFIDLGREFENKHGKVADYKPNKK